MQAITIINRDLTIGAIKQDLCDTAQSHHETGALEAMIDRDGQGMPLAGVFVSLNSPPLLPECLQMMLRMFYPKPESAHKLRVDDSATLGMIIDWLKESGVPYVYAGNGEWFMAYTIHPFVAESLMQSFRSVAGTTIKEDTQGE